jgi:uncharacterized repeat protein (TIGR01451 family)
VPLTVTWDPQPINLVVSGSVSPTGRVKAGDALVYTLVVQNIPASNHGAATQTTLTYQIPAGLTYLASNGDATSCAASSGTLTCNFGTLAMGASDLETIVVQANQNARKVESTFVASAREPDSDPGTATLMLSTKPNAGPAGPKGGLGGFGWLALAGLLSLALTGAWFRGRRSL